MKNLFPLGFLLCLFVIFSCSDVDPFEIDNVDFGDPSIGVPLINSTFYVTDLGVDPDNNTKVLVDNEGKVTLQYTDRVKPIPVSDWFPTVNDELLTIMNNPQEFSLPFNDIDIRNGIFTRSTISFEIENPVSEFMTIEIFIPEITNPQTGMVFSQIYTIAANDNFNSPDIYLNDWQVTTTDGSLELLYIASSNSGPIGSISNFKLNYKQLDFSYLEGIFKNSIYPIAEEVIDVTFFDNWVSGGLNLADPQLKINVENSVGIPAELRMNYAQVTTIDNEVFDIESTLLEDGISFDHPSLSEIGSIKTTQIEINSDNSNFKDLFDKKPSSFEYDIELVINPDQNKDVGFYTDASYINMGATVELPLHFKANDLILQDTFAFEEISYDQIDSTGELSLDLINAFPVGVSLNLYFMDANGNILFTLVDDNDWVSAAASPDPSLTVDQLNSQITSIPIAKKDLQQLPMVQQFLIKVKITTTDAFNDEFVWVYDHHGVDIKLGAILK